MQMRFQNNTSLALAQTCVPMVVSKAGGMMGQAKNRGTFEQRQIAALALTDKQKNKLANEALRLAQRKLIKLEKRISPHKPSPAADQNIRHRNAIMATMIGVASMGTHIIKGK